MDLYVKNNHLLSKLLAKKSQRIPMSSGLGLGNAQTPSLSPSKTDSEPKKKPINLFYSSLPPKNIQENCHNRQPRATTAKVSHNLDCSVVFITTSSDTVSDRPEENSGNSQNDCQIEEEGGDSDGVPFGDHCTKKLKTSHHFKNETLIQPQEAQRDPCHHENAAESHSNVCPNRACKTHDQSHRASFDEESDCSTACETHSDGNTTHEASEFSPFVSFQGAPKFEEMRLDDENFTLDSTTCSDEDSSYMREAMEIAFSFEGSCSSKRCSSSKSLLKFMCKLGHSFDLSCEDVKERWCPRCHQSLKNMQDYASSFNGRLLNKYYDDNIVFQCERDHIWTISSKNAKKRWCSQCLKDNKKSIKQQLEQERKQRQLQAEELQKKLFENARKQSIHNAPGAAFQSNTSANSSSSAPNKSMIEYFERMELEVDKIAKKQTSDYMSSQDYAGDCNQEQIMQVYKILAMPEEILKSYMFNLPLDCLRAEFRRLVKTIHPDKNKHPNAGSAFQRIHRIYESALGKFDASC